MSRPTTKDIFVVTSPYGYWERVLSSFEAAENWMAENMPSNWDHGYTIVEWQAKVKEAKT